MATTTHTVTPAELQTFLAHADRCGLIQYTTGIVDAWHPVMRGLTRDELVEAFAYYRDNGPPPPALFLRPHDIRKRVLARRDHIPHHLRCRDHESEYAYNCSHCRLQIEAPNPKSVEAAKQEARKAAEAARQKREAAIKAWHAARETEYLKFINPKDRPDQSG